MIADYQRIQTYAVLLQSVFRTKCGTADLRTASEHKQDNVTEERDTSLPPPGLPAALHRGHKMMPSKRR